MADFNRQEDVRAARRKKTFLLVIGGAVAVSIPLAGILYQRLKAMSIGDPRDWRPGFESRAPVGALAPTGDPASLGEAASAAPTPSARQDQDSVQFVKSAPQDAVAPKAAAPPKPPAAPLKRASPAPRLKKSPILPKTARKISAAYQIPQLPQGVKFSQHGMGGGAAPSSGGVPFRNGSPIMGGASSGRSAGQLPSTVLQGPPSGD